MDKFGSVVDRTSLESQDPVLLKAPACDCCRWCHPLPKGWCGGNGGSCRMMQRPSLCCSCVALSCFCGLMSSQYLISMRWMSCWRMLRSLGRCCLEKVDLLVAAGGGAAEVLPSSLSFPLPLLGTHPSKRRSNTSLRWKSQRALRKGSQLVLTLARAPPETRKKEKQQRKMRIRRVVSHAFRPAPSPPEASRSTSNPPIRSPIITVVVKVYFVSWLCNLVQAFDCMAVQFSN